jgi:cation diffusion facilitator CzcD-associated flavoprotein CzcO
MSHPESERHFVIVVGGGFSGVCMGIRLRQAGIADFVILERAGDLGGTWRDNRYPGCACDVESHLYSYSFEPNPDWSREYAEQGEILSYLRRCAEKYGVVPHLRFHADVCEARYDAAAGAWTVLTRDGRRFRGSVLVSGVGALSNPNVPTLPGLDQFAGPTFHSARWDHEIDLRGKRVAVIGSGASAVQFVPRIAPEVARLDYYQRTPPWVVPKLDWARAPWEKRLFRSLPIAQRLFRSLIYWFLETRVLGFVVHPRLMKGVEWSARRHIRRGLRDPARRAKVTPTYSAGCKRILLSNEYYPALARDNVDIVTDGIREVRRHGIVARDGTERPADVIIFGTGFRPQALVPPGAIVGAGGADLHAVWAARGGAEAYLGLTVHGFPNLYFLMGPNTGLGHSSMLYMIEAQVDYVMRAIGAMRAGGLKALDLRADVQARFNTRIQRRLANTVWASGCHSWYLDDSGKNTSLWPGFTFVYRRRTRSFRLADYAVETR